MPHSAHKVFYRLQRLYCRLYPKCGTVWVHPEIVIFELFRRKVQVMILLSAKFFSIFYTYILLEKYILRRLTRLTKFSIDFKDVRISPNLPVVQLGYILGTQSHNLLPWEKLCKSSTARFSKIFLRIMCHHTSTVNVKPKVGVPYSITLILVSQCTQACTQAVPKLYPRCTQAAQ